MFHLANASFNLVRIMDERYVTIILN